MEPDDVTTTVCMKLKPPGRYQQFIPMVKSSDSSVVSASIRGIKPPGMMAMFVTKYQVVYECKDSGSATITLTTELKPFDPIVETWTKKCGPGPAGGKEGKLAAKKARTTPNSRSMNT